VPHHAVVELGEQLAKRAVHIFNVKKSTMSQHR
jgi:hypothetical protein